MRQLIKREKLSGEREKPLAKLLRNVEEWNQWRQENMVFTVDLSYANLREANLVNADLRRANLSDANLFNANLSDANLSDANLSDANLSYANLSRANLSHANFSKTGLFRANFSRADLSYANLRGANLSDTNLLNVYLSYANLNDADLSYADLSRANLNDADLSYADLNDANLNSAYLICANLFATQALRTNFEGATLTGACIQDWNINRDTNLDGVLCGYVYLKYDYSKYTDRRPSDPSQIFAPGDFARLVQKAQETVDLIFRNGIDWQAFSNAFQTLKADRIKIEGSDRTFSVRAIENLDDGSFVVRINTPKDTDKGEIERVFQAQYKAELKQLETAYREKLQGQEREIELYREQLQHTRQQNTNLTDIT